MKIPNLVVILSIISFLSIILITGSPFKGYTNYFENNNHIFLIITPVYGQNNDDDFEYGNIFPNFEDDDLGDFEYGIIFPNFEVEDSSGDINGGKDDSDGSSGGSSSSSRMDDDGSSGGSSSRRRG